MKHNKVDIGGSVQFNKIGKKLPKRLFPDQKNKTGTDLLVCPLREVERRAEGIIHPKQL